jgi:hypothetical protein
LPGQFLLAHGYGYSKWEPRGDNKRIWLPAVEEILEEYRRFWPLTVRQCFYQLVSNYELPKDEKTYKTKVIPLLVNARRGEHIPFEAITDTGVFDQTPPHYADIDEFHRTLEDRVRTYTINKLARQDISIRVHVEAVGMVPQLRRVCDHYSIPVSSSGGFDSVSFKWELAQNVRKRYLDEEAKKTYVLHLGDFDPSGESVFESMYGDVLAFTLGDLSAECGLPRTHFYDGEEHLFARGYDDPATHFGVLDVAELRRIMLRPQQIPSPNRNYGRDRNLPTRAVDLNDEGYPKPFSRLDSRTKRWLRERPGVEGCQLDAMPADELAQRLGESIDNLLDLGKVEEDREREKEERQELAERYGVEL